MNNLNALLQRLRSIEGVTVTDTTLSLTINVVVDINAPPEVLEQVIDAKWDYLKATEASVVDVDVRCR